MIVQSIKKNFFVAIAQAIVTLDITIFEQIFVVLSDRIRNTFEPRFLMPQIIKKAF